MLEQSERKDVFPFSIAIIYAGLGEKDRTIEWLEKAYEAREYALIYIKMEFLFGNLRSDPRFQELMRRMNFQE